MMDGDPRSARVIAAYKRHKLSISALHHIRELLQQFEHEREFDRRVAWYGAAIIVAVLAYAAFSQFAGERVFLF